MRNEIYFLSCICLSLGNFASKASAAPNVGFTSIFDGNVVDARPFNITWNSGWSSSFATITLTKYEPIPGGYSPLLEMLTNFAELEGHLIWTPSWEDDKVIYKMVGAERENVSKLEMGFESEPFRILSKGAFGSPTSWNTKKTITLPQSQILNNGVSGVSSSSNSITTVTKAPSSEASYILKTSISTTATLNGDLVDQASTTASFRPSEDVPSNTNTLNRSAKIGIGFGATVAFLAFTIILAIFFFRYGKRVAKEKINSQDPLPEVAPPALRLDVTRPPSCRIETLQPFELWSPGADDLEKRGSAELEGWTGNGLFDTERGRRAEIDGVERIRREGSIGGSGNGGKRKSEAGSWLLSWGRWVERI